MCLCGSKSFIMHTPFTLQEAIDIQEDFEDLIDTDFKPDASSPVFEITNVLVAPYNEEDKKRFAENYHLAKEDEDPLSFYTGTEYDVIVFAYNLVDKSNYIYMPIRSFAERMGINYNYPGPEH
jgi:hypothetical protein